MFTTTSGATGNATSAYIVEEGSAGASGSAILRLQRRAPQMRAGGTVFVFSGGGARGALHVGALRALYEAGIRPDALVGTSIGAWNAAWLAHAPTLEGVEALAAIWRGLQPGQALLGQKHPLCSRLHTLKGLLMLTALRRIIAGGSSLYSNTGMRAILAQRFTGMTFDDLSLPLSVIATDLSHGGRAIFRHGPIVDAVLASSAIPGIFPPVDIDGSIYADGGMVDGCSIETAIDMGASRIFVMAIGYETEDGDGASWTRSARPSVPSVIQRASQVMGNYQIQRALERAPRSVETHLISLSPGSGGGSLNFEHVAGWIEQAYRSTRAYLEATHVGDERREAASQSMAARTA